MTSQSLSLSTSDDLELTNQLPFLSAQNLSFSKNEKEKPLLSNLEVFVYSNDNNALSEDDQLFFSTKFKIIIKDLFIIYYSSIMISFSYLSSLILLVINLHYIGRFNDPTLISAIGLGNVTINSLAINIQTGYNYGF